MVAHRFKRILVPTDFGPCARVAIPLATALAKRHLSELILLHVLAHDWDYVPPERSEVYASLVRYLKQMSSDRLHEIDLSPLDSRIVKREVRDSTTAPAGIVECARESQVDLIVIGSHGRRLLGQVLLGSVARSVLGHAPCPVLCVTPEQRSIVEDGRSRIDRVLVPTDFSAASRMAFQHGLSFARESGARLVLVHVVDAVMPPLLAAEGALVVFEVAEEVKKRAREKLDEWGSEARAHGVETDGVLEEGAIARRIAAAASERDIDLIVMSRRGADGGRHPLGGVVDKLLHDAPCPILVV
jgi:nucleotide-binding universal stress UspA family protein